MTISNPTPQQPIPSHRIHNTTTYQKYIRISILNFHNLSIHNQFRTFKWRHSNIILSNRICQSIFLYILHAKLLWVWWTDKLIRRITMIHKVCASYRLAKITSHYWLVLYHRSYHLTHSHRIIRVTVLVSTAVEILIMSRWQLHRIIDLKIVCRGNRDIWRCNWHFVNRSFYYWFMRLDIRRNVRLKLTLHLLFLRLLLIDLFDWFLLLIFLNSLSFMM